MAKGNLFLGQARGSVGDVTFARQGGQQVSRARNRSPRNPRSVLQVLGRIVFGTVGKAYSMMQGIADHSFEGVEGSTPNQSKFVMDNVAILRERLASVFADPSEEAVYASTAANYNGKGDSYPELNEYILSRGSLPVVQVAPNSANSAAVFSPALTPVGVSPSYAEVVASLGLQRGDQLTFCVLTHNFADSEVSRSFANGFEYARVILEPSSGDMSANFIAAGTVNLPNERNSGVVSLAFDSEDEVLQFSAVNGAAFGASGRRDAALAAVIVSRQGHNYWLRSDSQLVPIVAASDYPNADVIGEAYDSYLTSPRSDKYLNQAEGF